MDDPGGMCCLQCVDDLDRKQKQRVDVDRAATDSMLQRHSLEELHDDEGVAVLLADLVNRADVGMIQRGRGPRFPPEALDACGSVANSGETNFRATKRWSRESSAL